MIANTIKTSQPLVYRLLHNSLVNQQISHIYLLIGDNNQLLVDTAYLIIQSIIENKNDFACETCDTCLRIKDNNFADLRYFDAIDNQMKVDDLRNLIAQFNKTPVEKYQKKFFIINHFDNLSNIGDNAILKFIEEPTKNTYGFLLATNKDNLLPTILSRCQILNFKPANFLELYALYQKSNLKALDAYLLSKLTITDPDYQNSEEYQKAQLIFKFFIDNYPDWDKIYYHLQFDLLKKQKKEAKLLNNHALQLFIRMLIVFVNDTIYTSTTIDDWYQTSMKKFHYKDALKLMEILLDSLKDFENLAFNYNLSVDKMFYHIKKELN